MRLPNIMKSIDQTGAANTNPPPPRTKTMTEIKPVAWMYGPQDGAPVVCLRRCKIPRDWTETPLYAAPDIAGLVEENERLKSLVRGWHYLAVGPNEMGGYHTQKAMIKASEPYASPALAKFRSE
jgi:hypothetical protein